MLKKLIGTSAILGSVLFSSNAMAKCATYQIDPYHTSTTFTVDHHNLSNMRIFFTHTEGTFCVDKAHPEKSSVKAKVYMNTVLYPSYKGFTTHLKSSDYLNVKEFPLATFTSTKVIKTGAKTLDVKGTLNFLGKKKPYTIKTTFRGWGSHKGVEGFSFFGTFKINRKDYSITKYMEPTDEPNVTVELNGEALLPVFFKSKNPNKPIRNNYKLH